MCLPCFPHGHNLLPEFTEPRSHGTDPLKSWATNWFVSGFGHSDKEGIHLLLDSYTWFSSSCVLKSYFSSNCSFYIYLCVSVCVCTCHSIHVGREQPVNVNSASKMGLLGVKLGHKAWWHTPLPMSHSPPPPRLFFKEFFVCVCVCWILFLASFINYIGLMTTSMFPM